MPYKLLFVEDEKDLGNVVKQYLEFMGFSVIWHTHAKNAYDDYIADPNFHLLLIDIQLPDYDGFELAEKISKVNNQQAFLFLTARNEKKDRIYGLKIGADDYINKPFDIDELVLRIKNIIRRNNGVNNSLEHPAETTPVQVMGDLLFYKELLKLSFPNQKAVSLTLREAQLLMYLYENRNRILKREEILLHLWGENDYFLGRSLDVFISRLRKTLHYSAEVRIENVYGVGFIFHVAPVDN
ncbi:response regulator transcription factor [Olivibacter ginsenosidimutans]|uniref:Response regulator transcription factor n=1 Tax=Olivibacter ginsenosidimutans TaxID=1176537 RepID=A0ABP9AEI4_9SPHI